MIHYFYKNLFQQPDSSERRAAVVGEVNKPLTLLGHNCFTTNSRYIFQCQEKPSDFLLHFPADINTRFILGFINFQFIKDCGAEVDTNAEICFLANRSIEIYILTKEKIQPPIIRAYNSDFTYSKTFQFNNPVRAPKKQFRYILNIEGVTFRSFSIDKDNNYLFKLLL